MKFNFEKNLPDPETLFWTKSGAAVEFIFQNNENKMYPYTFTVRCHPNDGEIPKITWFNKHGKCLQSDVHDIIDYAIVEETGLGRITIPWPWKIIPRSEYVKDPLPVKKSSKETKVICEVCNSKKFEIRKEFIINEYKNRYCIETKRVSFCYSSLPEGWVNKWQAIIANRNFAEYAKEINGHFNYLCTIIGELEARVYLLEKQLEFGNPIKAPIDSDADGRKVDGFDAKGKMVEL